MWLPKVLQLHLWSVLLTTMGEIPGDQVKYYNTALHFVICHVGDFIELEDHGPCRQKAMLWCSFAILQIRLYANVIAMLNKSERSKLCAISQNNWRIINVLELRSSEDEETRFSEV